MITTVASLALSAFLAGSCAAGIPASVTERETKYCGAGDFVQQSETISYSHKETDEYCIKGDLPNYTAQSGGTSCANFAGTILVGYYDRFNENLIPNYKTYIKIGSIIRYKALGAETTQVLNELYQRMETDIDGEGTTINGFRSGMKSYAEAHGSAYVSEDMGGLNFEKYQAAVKNETPVAIFLSAFSLVSNSTAGSGAETITVDYYPAAAHVVVACGYKVDTYYNGGGGIVAQKTYLKVASGLGGYNISYLCLDGNCQIDKALMIQLL
ncbi:MAG: hypothetical protein HFE26_01645 [Clostridia bacterium]|nr:hypothetical protein [Clostridia bacterium]